MDRDRWCREKAELGKETEVGGPEGVEGSLPYSQVSMSAEANFPVAPK